MKRADYELYTWYPLTENEYWVDFMDPEFDNCRTIVCDANFYGSGNKIMTRDICPYGWDTMAKIGTYMFMIVEKPKLGTSI